jgi:hypothetical protein
MMMQKNVKRGEVKNARNSFCDFIIKLQIKIYMRKNLISKNKNEKVFPSFK